MVSGNVKRLVERYNKIEREIFDYADTLPNRGDECDCSDRYCFDFIDDGARCVCLNCGGWINFE